MQSILYRIGLISALAVMVLLPSCKSDTSGGSSSSSGKTDATANNTEDDVKTPTGDFYKRYEGSLAGKPVVLHLCRYNGVMDGYYQYTGMSQALRITNWEDTTKDDHYLLTEDTPGGLVEAFPHWNIVLAGNRVTGTWQDAQGAKSYDLNLREAYPSGSYHLSAFTLADSLSLTPGKPEPQAYAAAEALEATGPDAAFINRGIAALMSNKGGDLRTALRATMQEFLKGYRTENAEYANDTDMAAALNHTSGDALHVVYNSHGWLILENLTSSYSGGAHGGAAMRYLNLDVTNQKRWTLPDIFADTSTLYQLLDAQARRYMDVSRSTSLEEAGFFVDKIPATANVFILPEGITFVYDEYEIAAYAAGIISLYVPWKDVKPLLRADFKARMGL